MQSAFRGKGGDAPISAQLIGGTGKETKATAEAPKEAREAQARQALSEWPPSGEIILDGNMPQVPGFAILIAESQCAVKRRYSQPQAIKPLIHSHHLASAFNDEFEQSLNTIANSARASCGDLIDKYVGEC